MSLEQSLEQRNKIELALKKYLAMNQKIIEKEFPIQVPEMVVTMPFEEFRAWVEVYASRILLSKEVEKCVHFKEIIKKFLTSCRNVEIINDLLSR